MTGSPSTAAVHALVEFGQPEDLRQVMDRAKTAFRRFLIESKRLPKSLVDAIMAGDDDWVELLAKPGSKVADRQTRMLLLGTGHPTVADCFIRAGVRSLREMRILLSRADPADERWTVKSGPVDKLLQIHQESSYERQQILRAAVVCPFPQVIHHLFGDGLPLRSLTRAERLRALLSLHTHGGAPALARALECRSLRERPEGVAEYVEAALRDEAGLEALRAAVAAAEGTTGAIEELYGATPHTTLSLRDTLDWPAIQAAHQATAFQPEAVQALVRRADCPEELLVALAASHPKPAELLHELGRPFPEGLFGALTPAKTTKKLVWTAMHGSLGHTLRGADLLTIRSGTTILQFARESVARRPDVAAHWAEFRQALGELVAEQLGSDVTAWRALRERLDAFRGSIVDLLETVRRQTAGEPRDARAGEIPWPTAGKMPEFTEPVKLTGSRAAFLTVLDAAPCPLQWGLLAHMDARTSYDLLVLGTWREEWLDLALAPERRRERLLLSWRRDLPADAVTRLAELDDPEINVGLVYQRYCGWDERLALLTGTPFTEGHTDRLPTAELMLKQVGQAPRHWFVPWVASGDEALVDACYRVVNLDSQHLQLRLLLGRWERRGAEGLKEEMPYWFASKVRTLIGELLEDPDQAAALARLREVTRQAGTAEQLARRIRMRSRIDMLQLQGYVWDWDVLLAAHQRRPFPMEQVERLSEISDFPVEFVEPSPDASDGEKRAWQKLIDGQPAAKVLPRISLSDPGATTSWVNLAMARGQLTESEVLHFAKPARLALPLALSEHGADQVRQDMAALVGKHLDGRPDAWVLLLQMLPTFPGTVPQLLETVSAAV